MYGHFVLNQLASVRERPRQLLFYITTLQKECLHRCDNDNLLLLQSDWNYDRLVDIGSYIRPTNRPLGTIIVSMHSKRKLFTYCKLILT